MRIFRRLAHCSAFSEAASQVYSMAFSLSTSKRHFLDHRNVGRPPSQELVSTGTGFALRLLPSATDARTACRKVVSSFLSIAGLRTL
jgi:hypothetical protein